MPRRATCGRRNVLDRQNRKPLPLGLLEDGRWQQPGRPLDLIPLISRGRKGLRQKHGGERLQCIAFMDEVETLPPGIRQGEEITLHIGDLRCRKPLLRPSDRRADEIERRDLRARRGKTFGIVAEAAAHIGNP